MADKYPTREKFWAHKLVRIMIRTCAAQEIGPEGFCLVTAVAHTEDAKRYSAPVTWWNHQLQDVLGMSWGQLDRARKRSIKAGWLHYERAGDRTVGKYWTLLPSCFAKIPDGNCDCDADKIALESGAVSPKEDKELGHSFTKTVNEIEKETGSSREVTVKQPGSNREPSSLSLSLSLKKEEQQFGLFAKDEPKPNGQVTPDKFDLFWSVVHLRKGKVPARKAYEKAVKRIKKESPGTDPDQHLRDRMKLFDSSPEAHPDPAEKRRPIHPATWLNDGRYDDDEDTWFEHGGPMEDEKLSYGINQPKRNARPPAPPGPER